MTGRSSQPARSAPPVRTCIGCRRREVKSALLRVAVAGDLMVPDPGARLPGRGAYLHPSQRCFELAQRRRAFARALRAPGPLDTAPVSGYLEARSS